MRVTAPILAIACVFALRAAAPAAIGIEQAAPAETSAVEQRDFSDGVTARAYEQRRNFRLEEQRRAQMQKRVISIAAVVVPCILIGAVAFVVFRMKNANSHRATHKKLKELEARRRAGRPIEEAVDPRRW